MLSFGILGGTFDPIHFGHLRLAEDAYEALNLTKVILLPVGHPAHRKNPVVDPESRLKMVQLATGNNPYFIVDDSEIYQKNDDNFLQNNKVFFPIREIVKHTNYTIDSIKLLSHRIKEKYSDHFCSLVWIIGADAFLNLDTWHNWKELFNYCHFAVAMRPNYDLNLHRMSTELGQQWCHRLTHLQDFKNGKIEDTAGRIIPFTMTQLDISATNIRERLKNNLSIRYLTPESVYIYINNNSLYR